jgi:hypothetical protein
MKILSAKDWYYDQLRKQTGKTMSHFELAENYSKYLLEKQERSYSEEDIKTAFREGFVKSYDDTSANSIYKREEYLTEWFEQFKKK